MLYAWKRLTFERSEGGFSRIAVYVTQGSTWGATLGTKCGAGGFSKSGIQAITFPKQIRALKSSRGHALPLSSLWEGYAEPVYPTFKQNADGFSTQ